jgi:RNA polymerase sigma-70 factor (ECF subfamily)
VALGEEFGTVLAAAQARAEWAIGVLYREYHPFLLRYLRAQDRSVAEDLAADVWVVAAPRLNSFEGDESGFRAWLFTIARRRLIEHRRRCTRRRTDPMAPGDMAYRAGRADPEAEAVDAVSSQQAIDRLVAELTPEQAEVVLLRVVAGLDAAEVGGIVGKSPGAVRVIQHRALRQLASSFNRSQEVVTQ